GGGIFTKAADVGADLVGKVEAGIPEDDPRNPATIADNVGDNVGDCAGMAADVFESYEVTLVAAIILGAATAPLFAPDTNFVMKLIMYALLVRAVGVFASAIGILTVKGNEKEDLDPMQPINVGFYISALVATIGFGLVSLFYMNNIVVELKNKAGDVTGTVPVEWWRFFLATLAGIILAMIIGRLTEYFTSAEKKPVTEIAYSSKTGPATMIISGFSLGLESSVWSVLAIAAALFAPLVIFPPQIFGSSLLSFYGIALAGLGLLTTTGYILAMDTFGPISDNANGIFEMSGALKEQEEKGVKPGILSGEKIVARLDMVGNTTKALTKGFAIATAVVAATALFHSFVEDAKLTGIGLPIDVPEIFIGLLIGGAAPYLFSAFAINAVGRAAFQLIEEVRRQFREKPGIMAGTDTPDYATCVAIVTAAAQKELLGPGILAIALPVLVGFGMSIGGQVVTIGGHDYILTGAQALGGYLAGAILSGQLLAVLLANSGGAWDNAKKKIEDGLFGGKGTEFHKAGVICDTVGDPFKDTAGPALNPLIKVMNLVGILIAPIVIQASIPTWVRVAVVLVTLMALIGAVAFSKRGSIVDSLAAAEAAEAAHTEELLADTAA
ncbi:MAG: sodium-translocating pyrophosphatase, partial [Armatimonadetes bacterium]|nr:sodium-translocating pyrophosphatase [Armatimonadota bacterium]